MNRLALEMSEWLSVLSLMFGIGAIASGGILYAMTRVDEPIRTDGVEWDVQVPDIVVIEPQAWRDDSPLE